MRCCISRQVKDGFVSNAKAIIPVADGAENDVPFNPSEQDDENEVDVSVFFFRFQSMLQQTLEHRPQHNMPLDRRLPHWLLVSYIYY